MGAGRAKGGRREVQPRAGQWGPQEGWQVFPGSHGAASAGGWQGQQRDSLGGSPRVGLSPLVQERVEEREKQQGQLGQQRHPVVEVEGVCRASMVGAQGPGGAVGAHQPPLEILPGYRGTASPYNLPSVTPPAFSIASPHPKLEMAWLIFVGTVGLPLYCPQHLAHSWSSVNVH